MRDTENTVEDFHANFQMTHADRRFYAKMAEYHHVQDDSANNRDTTYGPAFNVLVKVITTRVCCHLCDWNINSLFSMEIFAMDNIWPTDDAFER